MQGAGVYVVCGGRDYRDRGRLYAVLDGMQDLGAKIGKVVTGGAAGADLLAAEWARARGVEQEDLAADWAKHGRAAGPIRNAEILERYQPAAVIAFPGGRGTADMVRKAKGRGIPVYYVKAEGG